jgi:hypothetical protein
MVPPHWKATTTLLSSSRYRPFDLSGGELVEVDGAEHRSDVLSTVRRCPRMV